MSWTENHGFSLFGSYNLKELRLDEAWLNLTNVGSKTLWLYQLSKDCAECPYTLVHLENRTHTHLTPGNSTKLRVSTKFPVHYRLEENCNPPEEMKDILETSCNHCTMETNLGEFGVYVLKADDVGCTLETELKPVSIYLPFLIPIIFYFCLTILIFLFQKYKDKLPGFGKSLKPGGSGSGSHLSAAAVANPPTTTPRQRLRSLDTFRGICIVVMIFVNDGAAGYYFLEHATWDGLYVADLVFPWFLWIMGVCIPVSIKSQVKRNTPILTIIKRITIRSLKLIAIGLMLNTIGGPIEIRNWRLPGVLQRFGICYFVAAISVLMCANTDFVSNAKASKKYVALVQDIFFVWKGWILTLAFLVLHTCLTFFLEVPGCPKGYLGPGGLHKGNAYKPECIGGAAGYIDRKILTSKHIYQWPTAKTTYGSDVFDPEGLLSTIPSFITVWLGVQAGLTLQVYSKHKSRLIRWAIWAVILGAIGAALCGAKQTGGPIPLNKNLWSLSFVMVLSSFALILLMILYVAIDMLNIWSGTPFFEPGMNSILLYIGHTVANDMIPWHFRFKEMNTHFKRLVESLWGTSLWVLYSIYLFHRKFFWSL